MERINSLFVIRCSLIVRRIKSCLKRLPIPLSRNHWYDLLTKRIIKKVCRENSNCIDVGVLDGEILDLFIQYAPQGHHFGFEPIPEKFNTLQIKYNDKNVSLFNGALSNENGTSAFNYVTSNPSYSGLLKRKYDKPNEQDTSIQVEMRTLDSMADKIPKVDLMKIDVEGAEFLVLDGARELIMRDRPVLIFEHGRGGADVYGITPQALFGLLTGKLGYQIYLMQKWLHGKTGLRLDEFVHEFDAGKNYYFVAAFVSLK